MTGPRVRAVIPVHDEELLLGACLRSVVAAADRVRAGGAEVDIVVVLDACGDRSRSIAAAFPVEIVSISARNVGIARGAGSDLVLPGGAEAQWFAHTDADSVVPVNWLAHQLDLMRTGADVMVGTVRPDFADLTSRHIAHWKATHVPGRPNGHVHGANLGVRAATYREIGGFAGLPEHEDVAFVDAARLAGAAIVASDGCEVLTSGRFFGRTQGGYAGYLREQSSRLDLEQETAAR